MFPAAVGVPLKGLLTAGHLGAQGSQTGDSDSLGRTQSPQGREISALPCGVTLWAAPQGEPVVVSVRKTLCAENSCPGRIRHAAEAGAHLGGQGQCDSPSGVPHWISVTVHVRREHFCVFIQSDVGVSVDSEKGGLFPLNRHVVVITAGAETQPGSSPDGNRRGQVSLQPAV